MAKQTTKKRTKPASPRDGTRAVTIRPKKNDHDRIVMDAREISLAGGFPVSITSYALHAVLAYPRLRKIEIALRGEMQSDSVAPSGGVARNLLENIR